MHHVRFYTLAGTVFCWLILLPASFLFAQTFSAATPPNTIVGETYSGYNFRLSTNQRVTYSLAPSSRQFPPGLTMNTFGNLTGRTTIVGTYSGIVIRALVNGVAFDSRPFTILVLPATAPTRVKLETLTTATVGVSASFFIGRANGFPVPTFSLAPGSSPLPEGLQILGDKIVGQARRAGTSQNIIIRASNKAGFVDSPPLSLVVQPNPSASSGFAAPYLPFSTRLGVTGGTVINVVQQNGYYILAGSFTHFDGRRVPGIVRVSPEGRYDPTFALRKADGTPLTAFGGISGLCILPDDKLVITGELEISDDFFGLISARIDPEGFIDTTFQATNLWDIGVGAAQALTTAPDRSIYFIDNGAPIVYRLQPNGAVDDKVFLRLPSAFTMRGVRVLRNGRILVFGDNGELAQFLPNGVRDTSFVNSIDKSLEVTVLDAVELTNGNILICAASRYFGSPVAYMMVIDLRGRVVVSSDILQPLFAEREPDEIVFTIPKFGVIAAKTALPLADGRVLLVMHTGNGFALYRLNADFSLDTNFQIRTGTATGGISTEELYEGVHGIFHDGESTTCLFGSISSYDGVFQNGIIRINTTSALTRITTQSPPPRATMGGQYPPYRFRADAEPDAYFVLAKYSAPLPPGMTLSTSGVLTGVPTTTGTFSEIFIRAGTRFIENAVTTSLTITVVPPEAPTNFLTQSLPSGVRSVTYATIQVMANGSPTPTYSLAPASARLPRGLTLSTSGILSGTPAVTGVSSIIIRATNAIGFVDSPVLSLRIDNLTPPTAFLSSGQVPTARVGEPFRYSIATNGSLPLAYSFLETSTTPPGLTISPEGVLTGIPEVAGDFLRIHVRAENTSGDYDTTFSLRVLPRVWEVSAGGLDTNFARAIRPNAEARTILRTEDGGYLIGGDFTRLGNRYVGRIARITQTGTLDTTFLPQGTSNLDSLRIGANGSVRALAQQADGKILVGGQFTAFLGAVRRGIVRLNADGTRDSTFAGGTGLGIGNGEVNAIAVQADGRILLGGSFTLFNNRGVNRLVRLNANGSVDTAFTQDGLTGVDGTIFTIKIQSNGRILLGGAFTSFLMPASVERRGILRLNTNGTLDTSLRIVRGIGVGNAFIADMDVQQDTVLLAGAFTNYELLELNNILRLDGTGNWQPNTGIAEAARDGLAPNAPPALYSMAQRLGGETIVVGNFTRLQGERRNGIASITANGEINKGIFNGLSGFRTYPIPSGQTGFPRQVVFDGNQFGAVVVGGFTHYGGTEQPYIARILLVTPTAAEKQSSGITNEAVSTAEKHHLQKERTASLSAETRISAYPNPFSESTTLRFSLPKRQTVRLSVYDAPGRLIVTLVEQTLDAGEYSIPLGNTLLPSSGMYMYRMQTESGVQGGAIFFVR